MASNYECSSYKKKNGHIFYSQTGYKYTRNLVRNNNIYLHCELRKSDEKCKGSAKIDVITNELFEMRNHNHELDAYKHVIYKLKDKSKVQSSLSRESLSIVFRDTTRNHPSAIHFSYKNIESAMYRARREVEPPIPVSAVEFTQTISSTILNVNYRHSVMTRLKKLIIMEQYSIQKRWP